MTILLLDTHAHVWALMGPDRLSGHARAAIEAPGNAVGFGCNSVGDGNQVPGRSVA